MEKSPTPLTFIRALDDRLETRREHARAVDAGVEVRVARGVYLDATTWAEIADYDRYVLRIRAVAGTRQSRPVFSHWSAAAIHGLPRFGAWPQDVHTTVSPTTGGRSRNGVVKHHAKLPDEDVVEIGGLLVTSVARTAVDLAMSEPFRSAVIVADRSILVDRFGRVPPMATKQDLQITLDRLQPVRAPRRAQLVIDFSVTRAESPLESTSRVSMYVVGCPRPELQISYWDRGGHIGDVDFDWPHHAAVGEADGKQKYFADQYRGERTSEQVIDAERVRHNRLAAVPLTVIRWDWATGNNPERLGARLLEAGLPLGKRWE